VVKTDCSAHSLEYDIIFNTFRPLFIQTDIHYSSNPVSANDTLIQTVGYRDNERNIRTSIHVEIVIGKITTMVLPLKNDIQQTTSFRMVVKS
jgi:hypothetical protein